MFLVWSLVGFVLVVATLGCSPPPSGLNPLTLTERVHLAKTVFHGKVLKKWIDPRFSRGPHKAYIVKTKVFCILKGKHLAAVVNVSSLGFVGGRCHRIDVDVGKEYIMFGDSLNGVSLEHYDMASIEASEESINLATAACGLNVKYPIGIDETNAKRYCPRTADSGDCTPKRPRPGPASSGGGGSPGGARRRDRHPDRRNDDGRHRQRNDDRRRSHRRARERA